MSVADALVRLPEEDDARTEHDLHSEAGERDLHALPVHEDLEMQCRVGLVNFHNRYMLRPYLLKIALTTG